MKHQWTNPREPGTKTGSFSKEIRKTPIDGDSETEYPETCLQPSESKLVDFLDELQKLAKDAFGIAGHAIIEQFLNAKMLPHLKKLINQAHLENGTYKHIVTHLETELELNGLEAPDELQINTVTPKTANANADSPKPTCHHCKKPEQYRNQCRLLKRQKKQSDDTHNHPGNKNLGANNSIPDNNKNKNNNNSKKIREPRKSQKLFIHPVRHVGRQTTPRTNEKCYYGAHAANRLPPRQRRPERQNRVQERANINGWNETTEAAAQNLN